MKIGLGDMLSAGVRSLSRYTGTLLSVFVVQTLVATACMFAMALVLSQAFSHLPIFDEGVDGDLVSLVESYLYARPSFAAIFGIMFGAILLWELASWFVVGGLYGVLAQRPEGRSETARCFGASGASTYLAYARLSLCSLPAIAVVLFALSTGLGLAMARIEHALSVWDLLGPLFVGLLPGMLLLHVAWTITDYARVELTLRQDTHEPGVIATYLRSVSYVLRRPVTLAHGAIGWLCAVLVTMAYMWLAAGHPMYGAEGAVILWVSRQCVSLLRTAIRVGVLAGQVELGRTRPHPPRRVEAKVDIKA